MTYAIKQFLRAHRTPPFLDGTEKRLIEANAERKGLLAQPSTQTCEPDKVGQLEEILNIHPYKIRRQVSSSQGGNSSWRIAISVSIRQGFRFLRRDLAKGASQPGPRHSAINFVCRNEPVIPCPHACVQRIRAANRSPVHQEG